MGLFVLLIGFPGVGKLTIAKELSSLIPAKVIDNHWINNPILRILDGNGTSPLPRDIWEYTGQIRQTVLSAICDFSSRADSFIFTHAGVEGDERSVRTYSQFVDAASKCDATFVPVRLLCAEEELVRRVVQPTRKERLKSIDSETARSRGKALTVLNRPHQNAFTIDVTLHSPAESASFIKDHILRVEPCPV